jgi:uncharacterized phage protein (TIGR02218 family)
MKDISIALDAYMSQSYVAIATLIRIDRTDGITLGFTDWDVPIVYSGLTYVPGLSMSPSTTKTNADMTTDQMDIIGAIDSIYILESDIDGGRFDLATVTRYTINPYDTTIGVMTEITGTVGQIDYGDSMLQVAINSLGQRCNQSIGDVVTPVCRVNQLGDAQCKVSIASFQFARTVTTVVDQRTLIFTDGNATGYYDYGMVRFESISGGGGLNHDLNVEVKTSTAASGLMTLVMQERLKFPVAIGDAVILEAGCDRRPITCRNKFSNLVNIHCEPYVPGNDYLLKTGRPPS